MVSAIGTDIIEVQRIAKAVKRWGNHFLNHVFTEEEIQYCLRFKNPFEHFAGRFAAKEAVIKCLSDTTGLNWKDIKIMNEPNGKPYCVIAKKKIKGSILISISHTENYATAFALITT